MDRNISFEVYFQDEKILTTEDEFEAFILASEKVTDKEVDSVGIGGTDVWVIYKNGKTEYIDQKRDDYPVSISKVINGDKVATIKYIR